MTENQKLHKQYAFEDFMKTVLRNKARNIHKKLDIQEQREAAASNFDESIFDSLITEDSYALDTMTSFSVKEHVFVVTPHIGKALSYLQPKHRDILLLSYFAEWSDSKIARYLGLSVSTVNDRRIQALQKLKQIMEYSKNTETFTTPVQAIATERGAAPITYAPWYWNSLCWRICKR